MLSRVVVSPMLLVVMSDSKHGETTPVMKASGRNDRRLE
jgi:hypothetical protein